MRRKNGRTHMGKKQKQFVILAGVLVILLLAYFLLPKWFSYNEEREQKEAEENTAYVTDMDEITAFSYDIGNGEMEFELRDGEWVYTADADFPLAQGYPQQIAEDFRHLASTRYIEDADELSAYGLDDPAYQVKLMDAEGNVMRLYFGNAVGDDYYVMAADSGYIYTVSSVVIADLQYTLDEMAQLDEVPAIGSGNLQSVTITQNKESVTYHSEENDDAESVAVIIGGLGALDLDEAVNYSAEEEELESYGLDEETRITVKAVYTEDGEEKTYTVYIGNSDGSGERYVMPEGSSIVYTVSESICDNILNVQDDTEE